MSMLCPEEMGNGKPAGVSKIYHIHVEVDMVPNCSPANFNM